MTRHVQAQSSARIHLLSTDYLDNTVTISVDAARYEYYLPSAQAVDSAEFILRRFPGKGLNFLKTRATKVERL